MDCHDAVHGPSGPKAAANLPASLPTIYGASPTAADLPAGVPTVDGAGPSPTAGFPADGPAVALYLHRPLQAIQVEPP